jgi:signal transduction histidine kinase
MGDSPAPQMGGAAVTTSAGLGLSISQGLARLMGGRIGVQSESRQGSRFHFE